MSDLILVEKIRKLRDIYNAGLLPELQRAMANAWRHRPSSPFEENEWLRCDVDHIARIASELTGDTVPYSRRHAVEALAKTRKQVAYELIDEVHAQIAPKPRRVAL